MKILFYSECVTTLILDQVRSLDGSTGDWQTTYARLKKQREDRNFIAVSLSTCMKATCLFAKNKMK